MFRIVDASNRTEMKAFFDFSVMCGYGADEAGYLRKYAAPALNPIRTSERAYLYAEKDGRVIGRLLTWRDRVYDVATGENCGFFSLCDAVDASAAALMDAMIERQRRWGSNVVKGPVSPDGCGFFNGVCTGNDKLCFSTPPGIINLPERVGFTELKRENSYIISVRDGGKIISLAERAAERFGMSVRNLEKGFLSDPLQKCVFELSQSRVYARQAERVEPFIDRSLSFAVYSDNACRGYLLVMKGKRPRIATLMTNRNSFSSAAVCILLSEVIKEAERRGISEAEAGVIDETNTPSVLLTGLCESRKTNAFITYSHDI